MYSWWVGSSKSLCWRTGSIISSMDNYWGVSTWLPVPHECRQLRFKDWWFRLAKVCICPVLPCVTMCSLTFRIMRCIFFSTLRCVACVIPSLYAFGLMLNFLYSTSPTRFSSSFCCSPVMPHTPKSWEQDWGVDKTRHFLRAFKSIPAVPRKLRKHLGCIFTIQRFLVWMSLKNSLYSRTVLQRELTCPWWPLNDPPNSGHSKDRLHSASWGYVCLCTCGR